MAGPYPASVKECESPLPPLDESIAVLEVIDEVAASFARSTGQTA